MLMLVATSTLPLSSLSLLSDCHIKLAHLYQVWGVTEEICIV